MKKTVDTITAPKPRVRKPRATATTVQKKAPLKVTRPRKRKIVEKKAPLPEVIDVVQSAPIIPAVQEAQEIPAENKSQTFEEINRRGALRIRKEYMRLGVLVFLLLSSIAFYLYMTHNYQINFTERTSSDRSL